MDFFSDVRLPTPGLESFETLQTTETFTIERIASDHFKDGEWYDQDYDEWVILLQGDAVLEFKDGTIVTLGPG